MRQVPSQVLDRESLAELESGHRLELVHGGKTIAEIVPVEAAAAEEVDAAERKRLEAVKRLMARLNKGYHLGDLKITDRGELYDRD